MKKGIFLIFLLISFSTFGQSSYLVYQLSGNVWEAVGKENKPLRVGQVLKSNTELLLDRKSGVTLICENYAAYPITAAGRYDLSKHHEICSKETYSITAEYFKFIWEELTHPHESPEDNRRKYMHNVGGAVRGCPGISIYPVFDNINFYREGFSISWESTLPGERLSFVLFKDETDGEEIFSSPVKENSMSMDIIKKHAGKLENVYWGIKVDGNEICPRKCIWFWPEKNYRPYLDSLQKLVPAAIGKAERNYMTGFFLEANFFISEAYDFYQQASLADPASERYRKTVDILKQKLRKN